ncbi:MAG: hypothetical protein QOE08_2325 [Thermoleophilaceae bacterium]|nr:hypothetical protein [Thermoleophilaceae bacterium]
MDDFTFLVLGAGLIAFGLLWALGRSYPGSGADVLDWKPTRSPEVEAQNELDDVDQMLEAQNERRRRSGRAEITEDDVRERVDREQREQEERGRRYRAERREP